MIPDAPFPDDEVVTPAAPLRTCDEDGTIHISTLKKLGDSGVQYLHAVNTTTTPTAAMLLGTLVHFLVLGPRPGARPLVRYSGATRQGNAWKEFALANEGAEILTPKEWAVGEVIAESVLRDPVARTFLEGARFEVPLAWEDGGIKCSTSGIDIVQPGRIGDLKTTSTTEVAALQRQAFKLSYHAQMAFYRRGARANGIDVSRGMFLVCVETRAPYECVVLEMSEDLIELGDRTVSLLLEKLRTCADAKQWPPRAQSPVVWTAPAWLSEDEEDDEEESEAAA